MTDLAALIGIGVIIIIVAVLFTGVGILIGMREREAPPSPITGFRDWTIKRDDDALILSFLPAQKDCPTSDLALNKGSAAALHRVLGNTLWGSNAWLTK